MHPEMQMKKVFIFSYLSFSFKPSKFFISLIAISIVQFTTRNTNDPHLELRKIYYPRYLYLLLSIQIV